MGTTTLACPVVRENGIDAGTFGSRLDPPPPAGTIPPPPSKKVMPVAVEEERDLSDLAILSVVTLESRSHLYLLINLT